MKKSVLQHIYSLRICIGYLGEADQYSWWSSGFFSSTSSAFLSPVFGKTSFAAQYYGVREAAMIVHDEHIGVGKGVFHLFRLPETHEIEMHRLLDNPDSKAAVQDLTKNKEAAENFLSEFGHSNGEQPVGPVKIGETAEILSPKTWEKLAGQYLNAFQSGKKTFPYFTTS
jgi:hypothetical protein